jgi:ATP-binding cassette subfamily B protein
VAFLIDTASNNETAVGTPAFTAGLNRLFGAAAIFMSIAIVRQLINLGATYVGEQVAWTATNALRADLAYHCLLLDMSFHKAHKPGELIERVDGDVNQLANFFSQLVIQLGSNILLVIGVLVLLWVADWRVGLSITAVAICGMVVLRYLRTKTVPRWQALRQVEADLFGYLEEWLHGTEAIRSAGAEPFVMRQLYHLIRERWLKMRSAMRMNVFVMNLPVGVFAFAYSAAYIFGDTLLQNNTLTIGGVYLIFYYLDVIRDPLWRITRQVEDLQRAAASINRLVLLWQEQPTMHDGPGVSFAPRPLSVQFDQVSFHYADDPETTLISLWRPAPFWACWDARVVVNRP